MKPSHPLRSALWIFLALSLGGILSACGQPEHEAAQTKRVWTPDDNPSLFADGFIYEYSKLPLSGSSAKAPWAGSYWPTYKDSINYKWDGGSGDSPAKKYERAFGVTFNLEDKVSDMSGIGSLYGMKTCRDYSQCDKTEACAKRSGATEGKCLPTWFGLCHAWAPAAIMEPEPQKPVDYNGVTFKINDIKALVTLSYTSGLEASMISRRCDLSAEKIKLDMYGNPLNTACIDTNPGSLHVVIANMLGLRKQAFIEDRRWDIEVWNHPVNSFKVNTEREISADEANTMIGILGDVISTDKQSGLLKEREWSASWAHDVGESDGIAVTLTGDKDVDLYVRFDAEPDLEHFDCRSATPTPNETCILKLPPTAKKVYTKIYAFAGGGPYSAEFRFTKKRSSAYVLNPKAARFKYMNMSMSIVGESDPSTDGNLASMLGNYTMTDTYEYILELDAADKIIGGEWLASSRYNHPDFLWLPTHKADSAVSGIEWKNVKMLLEKSTAGISTSLVDTPHCTANNGRGEGDIFDCMIHNVMMRCAKTDLSYAVICIAKITDAGHPV